MTNPVYSVFTVEVEFKGTFYDVEITPTLNGKPIEWLKERVGQWNLAETTNKLFSRKIVEMLGSTDPEYSLETHGLIRGASVAGFTVESGSEIKHKTKDIWDEFIKCLQDPVTQSHIAGLDPVNEDDKVVETGLGARVDYTPNDYRNLTANGQKEVRLSLFQKKCFEHFASKNNVAFPEYEPAEKACLACLLYRNPSDRRQAPGKEAVLIWHMQSDEEKGEMAPHVRRIREEMEKMALERQPVVSNESDDELLNSDDDYQSFETNFEGIPD